MLNRISLLTLAFPVAVSAAVAVYKGSGDVNSPGNYERKAGVPVGAVMVASGATGAVGRPWLA